MKDNELAKVRTKEHNLSEDLKKKALVVKNNVLGNQEISEKAKALFEKWLQETVVVQDDDVDADDIDEGEVEEAENVNLT